MSFLAPFAGLLAGGLAMAALVALHALKLRRRPVRVSSTLLWRDAVRDLEVNIPWRRPRLTPMFLLQALAVLLLALAIARPVMGDAGGVPGRLIVVIDASASMNATDGGAGSEGRTRLDEAKRLATERLGSLRRASGVPEIAVVRAALDPRMVVAPTRSVEAAIAGVRSVRATDQPLDADAVRTMLNALQDRSGDEDAPGDDPELWIFTDAGLLAARDFPGWSGEIAATNAGRPAGANAGIAALLATRDPTDPELARVFFRLVSNAERPTGVVARISVGDRSTPVAIQVPAAMADGPGSVTRTITVPAPGSQRIELALDNGGVLAADDRAWVDLPDASPPRTVVFAPEGRADPFLMDVLGVLAPGAVSVHEIGETDALRGAELAVYDRVTPQRLPPIASLGFGSGWPGLEPDAADTGRQRVIAWDRSHPVLRDLSLGPVVFDRAVALPDDATPGVTVLAEARTGPLIIEAVGGGLRHIRVGFPLARSNWAVDVGMPIFVAAAFERLAPGVRGEGVVHTTAQAVEVRAAADRVRADGPHSAEAPVSAEGVAVLGPLERAGVYTLEGAEAGSVAVSMLDARESGIAVGESVRFGRAGRSARGGDVAGDGGGRQELWPWLLLGAFVVMTLEWFVHARRARVNPLSK